MQAAFSDQGQHTALAIASIHMSSQQPRSMQ